MDRKIIELFDEYTHAPLDRRVFLERLTALAGGTAAATALLALIENNYAMAEVVSPDDPEIKAERVSYPGAAGDIAAYMARPSVQVDAPGVIVIHENRGLNPHIEDVVRRVAKAGFVGLGPDLLSPVGGTPKDEDQARDMIGKLDTAQAVEHLRAGLAWLATQPGVNGKVGAIGFCWGGGMVNQLAVAEPNLRAGVVFYGRSPDATQVQNIQSPLLLHYAGLDTRINEGVPGYLKALDTSGKEYESYTYENVEHAFHNDTNAARYNKEAAELAWTRTIVFLKQELG